MKKVISLMLVLSMLLSLAAVLPTVGAIGEETHGFVLGDASDDEIITAADVLIARKYTSGIIGEKDISLLAADVNGDGDITMADVILIRQILVGIKDSEGNNISKAYKVDTATIAERNISRFTIVIAGNNACMENSAKMLRNYINDACGITLNVTNSTKVNGYKINYVFDSENKYELGKEGYRIDVTSDGDLNIYCGSMRGPLYATDYLLEEWLGYRFVPTVREEYNEKKKRLEPKGDYITYLYEAENVNLASGFTETEVPVFNYRAVSQQCTCDTDFMFLRDNSCDGAHNGAQNARYGWAVGTLFIHAHSYELQCGISPREQPCLTKEETYNQIVEYNLNLLKQRENGGQYLGQHYTQISCSPNDNTNFCQCTNCMAVYREEGSIGGTIFRLSNRVAERLEQDYPGIEIYTIAYWDARNPPKMTRPRENIYVCFCIGGCNNHTYDSTEECVECGGNFRLPNTTFTTGESTNSSNADDLSYFNKWTELTNNLMIWYYSANFNFHLAPAPNIFNVYNDIKYVAQAGASGVYSEGSSQGVYSFESIRAYLISKMLWNPFMSEEEFNGHLNEALMVYYGDGWQYIREYIELANQAGNAGTDTYDKEGNLIDSSDCWTTNFDRPFNMYSETYMREHYDEMATLFEKAYAAAKTDGERKRISLSSVHCHFVGLSATYERDWVNGSAETKAKYAERYNQMYKNIVDYDMYVTGISDGMDKYGCSNFPKSGEVINPMTWIYSDFTGYWIYENGRWV